MCVCVLSVCVCACVWGVCVRVCVEVRVCVCVGGVCWGGVFGGVLVLVVLGGFCLGVFVVGGGVTHICKDTCPRVLRYFTKIGRASCRERVSSPV